MSALRSPPCSDRKAEPMFRLTSEEDAALRYVEKWTRGGAPLIGHQGQAAIVAAALRRLLTATSTGQEPAKEP